MILCQVLLCFKLFIYRVSIVTTGTVPNICLFKVNNRNTRKTCEICSKLTRKTPERRPEFAILSLYGEIRVRENPYSGIFYALLSNIVRDFQKIILSHYKL